MSELTVAVPEKALRRVLLALNGPPHYIRELQYTRNLPGEANPIDELCDAYNKWAAEYNAAQQTQTQTEPT